MERKIAYDILCAVLIDGQYASLAMKKMLSSIQPERRGFVTELVNGVLRNLYLLEYQFKDYLKSHTKRQYSILLSMAFYERYFLEKENYTANEYVKLLKDKKARAFINAILRKDTEFKLPDLSNDEGKAIYYSLPLWLFKLLKAQYSPVMLNFILEDLLKVPKLFYRINHRKANPSDLAHLNIEMINEDSFIASDNLLNKKEFTEGFYYVQDLNSAKIINELELKDDDVFLDLCAAPGSKMFNALDILNEENVFGNDINNTRLDLIRKKGQQLGYKNLNLYNIAAEKFPETVIKKATKILIDAPCSGLGVMKRKPDIRYRLKDSDLDKLVSLQESILRHVSAHMQKGAILVYSTCTLNTKENDRQIKRLLESDDSLKLIAEKLYLEDTNADRFYSAKLIKIR